MIDIKDFVGNQLTIGDIVLYHSPQKNKLKEAIIKKISSTLFVSVANKKIPVNKEYIIAVDLKQVLYQMKCDQQSYKPIKTLWEYLKQFPGYRISNFNNVYRICYFDDYI